MGKSKRHYEDKHYESRQKNQTKIIKYNDFNQCLPSNKRNAICSSIIHKESNNIKTYWYQDNSTRNTIIEVLNTICDNKENIGWTLECISELFNFACKQQQINFVLSVVVNFKDKYYAKITSGKIIDWCDLNAYKKTFHINSLHTEPLSSWWIKGFHICSQVCECVVCYDDTYDNIKTKCGHIFCRKCIGQHLEKKTDCPYCRTSLLCDRRGSSYDNYYRYIPCLAFN